MFFIVFLDQNFNTTGKEKTKTIKEFEDINRDDLINTNMKKIIVNNIEYITTRYEKADIRYDQSQVRFSIYLIQLV